MDARELVQQRKHKFHVIILMDINSRARRCSFFVCFFYAPRLISNLMQLSRQFLFEIFKLIFHFNPRMLLTCVNSC